MINADKFIEKLVEHAINISIIEKKVILAHFVLKCVKANLTV